MVTGMGRMIPLAEGASKLGLTVRRLQALCQQRRVPGARLIGRSWFLPENLVVTPGERGPISEREAEMNAEAQNRLEEQLKNELRNQINHALRAPGYESVTVIGIEIEARRLEGVGEEAQYQFEFEFDFDWTWKRRDATIS
jgi:hypothetical protein